MAATWPSTERARTRDQGDPARTDQFLPTATEVPGVGIVHKGKSRISNELANQIGLPLDKGTIPLLAFTETRFSADALPDIKENGDEFPRRQTVNKCLAPPSIRSSR